MPRKSKLTPEVQLRITQAIAMGATYRLAAAYGGISVDAFTSWMKKGESGRDEAYAAFYDAVRQAEGVAAVGWLAKIEQAANTGVWQAAAWKLERRYPQEYGRQSLELVGKDGAELPPPVVFYLPKKDDPAPQ